MFDDGKPRENPPVPPPRAKRRKKKGLPPLEAPKKEPFTFRYSDYENQSTDEERLGGYRYTFKPDLDDPNRPRSYLDVEHPDPENDPLPRTLYDELHVPDNYTMKNFMEDMQINPFPDLSTYGGTLLRTSRFVLQFTVTLSFYITYYHMLRDSVAAETVFLSCVSSTPVAYLVYRLSVVWSVERRFRCFFEHFPTAIVRDHLRVSVIYLLLSFQLTPILRTLSATISADTIHAIAFILWSLHLLTCDYGIEFTEGAQTLSVNAAVLGCICMTSTVASDYHTLALLTMAIQMFLLFPLFSHILWDYVLTLVVAVSVGAVVCYTVSKLLCIMYSVTMFFVIFIVPALYVVGIPFKYNIYGPWDEAVITQCLIPEKKYKQYAY